MRFKLFGGIPFSQDEFTSLILDCFMSDYVEEGGTELAFRGINFDGKMISFETSNLFNNLDLNPVLEMFNKLGVNEFNLKLKEVEIIGYSEYGNDWLIGTGDKISLIQEVMSYLWNSLYEQ